MNPKKRKKEPPDQSFSLYGSLCAGRSPSSLAIPLISAESSSRHDSYPCLNLCHRSANLLSSGMYSLPIADLSLHVLEGTRSPTSFGSCARPSLLLASASFPRQFETSRFCVALGGSQPCARVCLWVHQTAHFVDASAKVLDIQREGLHLDEVAVDTSNRFVIFLNLGNFQVCGFLPYFFTIFLDLLWSFRDLSLLGYYMDFVLPPCYFGCFHGYVSVGCRIPCCKIWYSTLQLPLAASSRTVGTGPFWELHQIRVFIALMIVSTIAYTLLPDRGSISWFFAQSMILSNYGPLVGNLWLTC